MQFRIFLVFLLTSLVAASPLWERAPKKKPTTKAADPTTKAPASSNPPATSAQPTSAASSKASSVVSVKPTTAVSSAASSKASSAASSQASSKASSVSATSKASSAASGASTSAPSTTKAPTSSSASSGSGASSPTVSGSSHSSSGSLTQSGTSSSSASSSSASASSTALICGKACGTKSCPVKPKTSKRAEIDAEYFAKRTLEDVSSSQADKYVVKTIDKAGSTNGLDYTFSNDFAVSKHGSFANKPFPMFVTGLEGCTGVAIVSEKGYWISHFMEEAYQPDKKTQWASLMAAVNTGNTKYTKPDTLTDLFSADSKPEIYIMRPRDGNTNALLYEAQTKQIMDKIQTGALASVKVNKLEYKKPKNLAELNDAFEKTARGKMLIEYDNNQQVSGQTASPQQAVARIFMENTIYDQKWSARDNQKEGAADEKPAETAPEHRPTCLKDDTKTLTETDITTAFDSVFKTAIDVSSEIKQTGTSGDVKVQFNIKFSASQAGCKVASGRKIMKTMAKRMVLEAAKQCPKSGSTTEFMGSKPDVYNTSIGCLDIEVFKA
ncbi:hypothetical protein CC80DRAFT_495573 [Byssothecium circinans]|uniref:Uncharacterized protein n=1 Tax=Byssothecium circinans TaxID=147558 RepID=A0A6A5TKM2_9PLEO|nr:hypothetical protein CC80DRAFT_495573 [Byssothecium circinans]